MIRTFVITLVLFAAGGLVNEAQAQRSSFSQDEARDAREAGEIIPASEMIRLMERRYPSAQSIGIVDLYRERAPFYLIRVITPDGRRLDIYADARTGREIPPREIRNYRY
ncbi:hypothetical protein E5163_02255 [Marinicauda algicola]|uniref:PepSY domain-containing protein n=1 Tax=Marinicauda algicola TaxID=2029849 RepID=A0A4S2H348_9PROT|nr:PepSY domain-containing protein [Marinicauda algicola]TGY89976.1 hypothetical protein E5163_02255 [Marinicauda algicola]